MKLTTTINKTRFAFVLAALTLLGAALPAFAGRMPGPGSIVEQVLPRSTDRYTMTFRGGELARIAAKGDGDIDLYIYDENGIEVARDTDADHVPVVSWTPRWSGKFTVLVKNAEGYAVDYALVTN